MRRRYQYYKFAIFLPQGFRDVFLFQNEMEKIRNHLGIRDTPRSQCIAKVGKEFIKRLRLKFDNQTAFQPVKLEFDNHKDKAHPIRNNKMLENSDYVVIFEKEDYNTFKSVKENAKKRNLHTFVIKYKETDNLKHFVKNKDNTVSLKENNLLIERVIKRKSSKYLSDDNLVKFVIDNTDHLKDPYEVLDLIKLGQIVSYKNVVIFLTDFMGYKFSDKDLIGLDDFIEQNTSTDFVC